MEGAAAGELIVLPLQEHAGRQLRHPSATGSSSTCPPADEEALTARQPKDAGALGYAVEQQRVALVQPKGLQRRACSGRGTQRREGAH